MLYASLFIVNSNTGDVISKALFTYSELKEAGCRYKSRIITSKTHHFIFKKVKFIDCTDEMIKKTYYFNKALKFREQTSWTYSPRYGSVGKYKYERTRNRIVIHNVYYIADYKNCGWSSSNDFKVCMVFRLFDTSKNSEQKLNTFKLMYECDLFDC